MSIENEPADAAAPHPEAAPTHQSSGNQTNITTGGGDVAEHDIDKRQGGAFIDGKVYGPVIGKQVVQQAASLSPALHQLRAPVGDFVGRQREIDQLVQTLSKPAASGVTAAISGVHGMGGIGKTELAYAAAQRLAPQFPDAQLLVELRGVGSSPLTTEQALQTVIRAFERDAKLPDDLAQLKGPYSSVLTGKRVLIFSG
jgi:hypothetical protein